MGAEILAPLAMWGVIGAILIALILLFIRNIRKRAQAEAEAEVGKGVADAHRRRQESRSRRASGHDAVYRWLRSRSSGSDS